MNNRVSAKTDYILYMEDDAVLARFFQKKMEKSGFRVDIAKNGEEGLAMLVKKKYDIIALDYKMPIYGGLQVLEILSKQKTFAPTIMVTGYGDEKIAVEAMKLGACDYIVKDVDGGYIELLPAVIKRVLKQRNLEEETRQATLALRREQKLFMGGPVTVFKWDASGNWPVEYVSSNVTQFGYNADDLITGKISYLSIIYPDDIESVIKEVQKFSSSGVDSFEQEYRIKKGNGEIIWVYHFTIVVKDDENNITHYDGYLMDITERKFAEAELREAKEKAEAAMLLKDKFVSLVSHDLRSPFISMIGLLKLIRKKESQYPLHDHTKGLLNRVIESGDHMVSFIERILNINQLRSGKIEPRFRFVIAKDLSAKVISHLTHLANEKNITLVNNISDTQVLFVDPDFFSEVIQNLISNSIKFCKSGDSITLFVPDENKNAISIRDTGVGISKERVQNIFKYESESSTLGTNGEKGAGIGLPLCYEIMQAHKGTLTVTSLPENGSIFTASLPPLRPAILVVDKMTESVSLKAMLFHPDFKIIIATDEREASEALIREKPHLIILNPETIEKDAIKYVADLKQNRDFKDMLTILFCKRNETECQELGIQQGVNDFLIKPVKQSVLRNLIKKHLKYSLCSVDPKV